MQVKTAYQLLDNFHHGSVEGQPSVTALMEEAELLRKQQDLFELYVSDYIFLQRCMVRRSLRHETGVLLGLTRMRICSLCTLARLPAHPLPVCRRSWAT